VVHPGEFCGHDRALSLLLLFAATLAAGAGTPTLAALSALATLGPVLASLLSTLALTLAGTAGLALLGFTIAPAWLALSTAGARAGATGAVRLLGLARLVLGLHVAFVLLVAVELSATLLTFDLVLHARPPSWRFNE
jgi:hypothetical protein